ncbi:MAG: hypothetical protein H0V40_10385, partial [Actinobacteria bacterium]|nr:hypothetical protein [Actinomycetota bacterium]
MLAALLVAGSATAEPAQLTSKRAQAEQVLGQIRAIDSRVAQAAEAYNLATIQLGRIQGEERRNARLLAIARTNFGHAQTALEQRLVTLYTSGSAGGSSLEVLLGATSLENLIDRIETVDQVSTQDARVLQQVTTIRTRVRMRRAQLARARAEQAKVVAARAAQRAEVERQLGERQRLLSSIRGEIARLEAIEAARQRELVRRARARLAAQAAA